MLLFRGCQGSTPLPRTTTLYGIAPSEGYETPCPQCGEGLTLHQPDEALPDRLLGTCDECKGWFLLNGDGRIYGSLDVGN